MGDISKHIEALLRMAPALCHFQKQHCANPRVSFCGRTRTIGGVEYSARVELICSNHVAWFDHGNSFEDATRKAALGAAGELQKHASETLMSAANDAALAKDAIGELVKERQP